MELWLQTSCIDVRKIYVFWENLLKILFFDIAEYRGQNASLNGLKSYDQLIEYQLEATCLRVLGILLFRKRSQETHLFINALYFSKLYVNLRNNLIMSLQP